MIARSVLCAFVVLLGCGSEPAAPDGGSQDAGRDGGPPPICERDSDCEDSLFCTEHECRPGDPAADARGCVLSADGHCAAGQVCDEESDMCMAADCTEPDMDTDNHRSFACGGDDCDDTDGNRYAGNVEVCDSEGHDEDCIATTVAGASDGDLDGDGEVSAACCNGTTCGADCDDTSAAINTAAREQCNGVDDDCSGAIDDAPTGTSLCPGGTCMAGRCSFAAWDRVFGGSGNDSARAITSDSDGNLYVSGQLNTGADFGTGPVSQPVIASYAPDGELRWVVSGETSGGPGPVAQGLAFDASTNRIYLLARGGVTVGSTTAGPSAFVMALDPSGTIDWARSLPTLSAGFPHAGGIVAHDGRVLVASSHTAAFDFGDGVVRTPAGSRDAYVAALDASDGSLVWVRTFGAAGAYADLRTVSFDDTGGVYAAGDFLGGAVDFGDGPVAPVGAAICLIALDADGADRWSRVFDSADSDSAAAVAVGSELVFIAGGSGGIDFGSGSAGAAGNYVVALATDGTYRWERILHGTPTSTDGNAGVFALAAFDDDRVWAVGALTGTVDFGGGGLSSTAGTTDVFMVLYRNDRLHLRDRALGGAGTQMADSIVIGPGGSTTIAGSYYDSITLFSGTRTAPPGTWGFVARTND